MTSLNTFLLFLILLSIATSDFTCTEDMYQTFLTKWGRNYTKEKTSSSFTSSFDTYCQNLRKVYDINSQNLTYKLSPDWKRMDMTDEEVNKILKKSFSSKINIGTPTTPQAGNIQKVSANLPPYIDYRQTNQVSSIKDQGQCGSCWAFATVGLYESWMMFKGEKEYDLSEEYVLECTTQFSKNVLASNEESSCDGGYPDLSGEMVKITGIPLESAFPYVAINYTGKLYPETPGICDVTETIAYAGNPQYTTLTVYENITKNRMKQIIAMGPVAASIYMDDHIDKYSSGVYTGCPTHFSESYDKLNHVVVVVGYDVDGNYIIKNSWGTEWGTQGYAIISREADCGLRGEVMQYTSNAPSGNGVNYNRLASLGSENLVFKLALPLILVLFIVFY